MNNLWMYVCLCICAWIRIDTFLKEYLISISQVLNFISKFQSVKEISNYLWVMRNEITSFHIIFINTWYKILFNIFLNEWIVIKTEFNVAKIIEIPFFQQSLKWSRDLKPICFSRVQKLARKHKLLRDCKKHIGVRPVITPEIKE